jgi:hypothetical protein
MRIGVIADLMPSDGHLARNLRQTADVGAALKESGRRSVPGQDLQYFGSGLARSVVKGKRNRGPGAGAFIH